MSLAKWLPMKPPAPATQIFIFSYNRKQAQKCGHIQYQTEIRKGSLSRRRRPSRASQRDGAGTLNGIGLGKEEEKN
jgi:hypothetical protein